MKEINLTQGKVSIVSDEDYQYLSSFAWYAAKDGISFRAQRCYRYIDINGNKKTKTVFIHNSIIESIYGPLESGVYVDHINNDPMDNRRENLRLATRRQNASNVRKTYSKTSSIYKGVSWKKNARKWLAEISPNRQRINLGVFDKEKDAARAYNEAAVKYFGEFARLNVIE